jgi:DNA gyrase subunit A
MGRLHPHGDGAIYDALVRMVQPWSLRLPMVDGHGNFGSPDAGPAAMRYTECRMAQAAMPMVRSIDEDTVEFKPNYDSRELEPTVLPAAIPNLLVNGASGIAVGMATNMAPHNLVEVVQALRHLITHPTADLDALMRFVPGPDLPTGGKIIGLDGIRDAYESGRGTFKMRATTRIESVTPRRKGIVVTELPYGVGPEKVIERIKVLVQGKKLQGISDVKDLTDLDKGLRLVIEVKNGFNPEAILEQLFKLTPMEDSFGINNVALVDGQPRTLGLKQLLEVYLEHRYDVVRRRSAFRRAKAADRLHLVEGLLLAILDIDEVIQLIRTSENSGEAKERLMTVFDLTDPQATYILDMQLRRLTRFSRLELENEKTELERQIEELDAILSDERRLRTVVSEELAEVAKAHGTPRRTVLLQSAGQPSSAAMPLEVPDEPCFVYLSSAELLARSTDTELPDTGDARTTHDVVVSAVPATARGQVGVLTSGGRLVRLDVLDLPTLPGTASDPHLQGGVPVSALLQLEGDERVVGLCSLAGDGPALAVGTRRGVVKRVNPELLNRDSWELLRLDDGDEVVGALEVTGDEELAFVTSDAQLLHFPAAAVRPQGRTGGGVAGIRLAPGAEVVHFSAVPPARDAVVVTISGSSTALPGTEAGSAKVTPFSEYPAKGRATGGVRCHRFLKGEDTLVLAWVGAAPARAAAASGAPVDLPPAEGRRDGSGTPPAQPVAAVASPVRVRLGP